MTVKIPSRLNKVHPINQKGKGASGKCDFIRITERQRLALKLSLHPSLTHVMTPKKTDLRKSKRTSALTWKEGDTQALLGASSHRTPDKIAATRKKAMEAKKAKEQVKKAKEKKAAHNICRASKLEDALVKESKKVDGAFPHRLSGKFNWWVSTDISFFTHMAIRCWNKKWYGAWQGKPHPKGFKTDCEAFQKNGCLPSGSVQRWAGFRQQYAQKICSRPYLYK